MSLDPATTAAVVASLAARADDGKFSLTATPTSYEFLAGHPAAESLRPPHKGTEPRYIIAWQAVYKLRHLGEALVCTQPMMQLAMGHLANSALATFDALDLKLQSFGAPNPASSA
jgi:hypothetical protein